MIASGIQREEGAISAACWKMLMGLFDQVDALPDEIRALSCLTANQQSQMAQFVDALRCG